MQPTSEQSILERIKVSRGTSEPVTAPTENHEVVNVDKLITTGLSLQHDPIP